MRRVSGARKNRATAAPSAGQRRRKLGFAGARDAFEARERTGQHAGDASSDPGNAEPEQDARKLGAPCTLDPVGELVCRGGSEAGGSQRLGVEAEHVRQLLDQAARDETVRGDLAQAADVERASRAEVTQRGR